MESFLKCLTFLLLMVVTRTNCAQVYNSSKYVGYRQEGILALYNIKDRGKAVCYGIFVDDLKALFPCECLSAGKDPGDVATPYSHPEPAKPVYPVDLKLYEVGLMSYEFNHDDAFDNRETIKDVTLHPGCNGSYLVNFAAVTLSGPLAHSRLVWINSDQYRLMTWQSRNALHSSQTTGICMLLRWVPNESTYLKLEEGIMKMVVDVVKNNMYIVTPERVVFANWYQCIHNVCPIEKPDPKTPNPAPRNLDKYCFNNNSASRHCANWLVKDQNTCNVTVGTPIFCDMGHTFQGVIGLVTKAATGCFNNYAVVAGIQDALELVKDDLRIVNAPQYKETVQWWKKFHRAAFSYDDPDGLSSSSVVVISIFLVISTIVISKL